MGTHRTSFRSLIACVLLPLGACAVSMDLPPDFLDLNPPSLGNLWSRGEMKAVTPGDASIWMRSFSADQAAPLEFWREAVERDLVDQRGYQLVQKGEAARADGDKGAWLECTANVEGERVGYLFAVWVDGSKVRVIEFTAAAKEFAERLEAVRASLATARW